MQFAFMCRGDHPVCEHLQSCVSVVNGTSTLQVFHEGKHEHYELLELQVHLSGSRS